MAKQILDLFQLYHLVVKHGGLVQVNYSYHFSTYSRKTRKQERAYQFNQHKFNRNY